MIFYWLMLYIAIFFEVLATVCMKLSYGFTKTIPTIFMGILYLASFALLTYTIKKIEIGMAYAIWSGLGTALIAIIGIYWFSESMSTAKFISIILIIIGVVVLNLEGVAD